MSRWSPILPTDDVPDAWSAVDAVVNSIGTGDQVMPDGHRHRRTDDAVLYAYLALARGSVDWASRAVDELNDAIEAGTAHVGSPGLFGGLSGLGWTAQHVSRVLEEAFPEDEGPSGPDEATDPVADIDTAIVRRLEQAARGSWPGAYDLISGLVGCGVYFLERLPVDTAARGLELVLDHLEATSRAMTPGLTWFTPPERLPDWQRELCPEGYYNLGVAHGVPGVIHLLSEIAAAGIDRPRAGRLLEGSMEWLMAQKRPAGSRSWFSGWLAEGRSSSDSRLTWCYGDLGILAVLRQVAARRDESTWRRFADELLDHCLAWPPLQSGVNDAPLCHGAAGLAQVFNRLYQAEGDVRCRDAALAWYRRVLEMRRPGEGVGGFWAVRMPTPESPSVREPRPSLLDGAIGVALALLSALTPIEPAWDRQLLLSGRRWSERP